MQTPGVGNRVSPRRGARLWATILPPNPLSHHPFPQNWLILPGIRPFLYLSSPVLQSVEGVAGRRVQRLRIKTAPPVASIHTLSHTQTHTHTHTHTRQKRKGGPWVLEELRVQRSLPSQAPHSLPRQQEEGTWGMVSGTWGLCALDKNGARVGPFVWSQDAFHTTH